MSATEAGALKTLSKNSSYPSTVGSSNILLVVRVPPLRLGCSTSSTSYGEYRIYSGGGTTVRTASVTAETSSSSVGLIPTPSKVSVRVLKGEMLLRLIFEQLVGLRILFVGFRTINLIKASRNCECWLHKYFVLQQNLE